MTGRAANWLFLPASYISKVSKMSWSEINMEKGMPYGGLPHDALLYKLEETDPELISEVRGDDPMHDTEDDYDEYARAEIIDWTPDDTYLESDHPRRDPALSRSMINLRYAGGRGPNDYRLPQHPELFLGFTGNDPRGADTQPRFDKLRAQTIARAREREVRMGHNVGHGDFIEADRPWGGAAMEYDKKEMQRRLKGYYHWFDVQKEGRPWGRNTITDEYYGLRQRQNVMGDGDEGLFIPEQDQQVGAVSAGWIHQSTYDPVRGAETDGVRRADRPRDADSAPWRNTTGDADLGVERYTAATGGGRETFGPGAAGGARAGAAQTDQDFGGSRDARAANRRVLAAAVGAAASHRRALARQAAGDTDPGASLEGARPGRSAPELARDIARAAREARPDQDFQAQEVGALGPGAGLGAPPADRQAALRRVQPTHVAPSNVRLANADAMVRGLRAGTAAQFRMVQGQAVAAGVRGSATGEIGAGDRGMPGGGLAPAADRIAIGHASDTPLARAAAAADLEVHNYGRRSNLQGAALDPVAWGAGTFHGRQMMPGRRPGRSGRPEFRSHTQDPATLGADPDLVFGAVGEHAGPHTGGLSIGDKNLRASVLQDGGDDVMSAYTDFDGLGAGMSEAAYRMPMGVSA